MHKLEFVQENENQNILWYFEVQTDHLIPVRRPDLVVVCQPLPPKKNKSKKPRETYRTVDFTVSANHRMKIKYNEKRDKY